MTKHTIHLLFIFSFFFGLTACSQAGPAAVGTPTSAPTMEATATPIPDSPASVSTPTLVPTVEATATPNPDSRLLALEAVCPQAEMVSWTDRWSVGEQVYQAALVWPAEQADACLAFMQVNDQTVHVVAHSMIEAGYSERYSEYSAPALQAAPVFVDESLPLMVTSRQSQGAGGGGGDLYTLWRVEGAQLLSALDFSLESYTDINSLTESPCDSQASSYEQVGDYLAVTPCFDGDRQPTAYYHFDGNRFVLDSDILELVQKDDLQATLRLDGQLYLAGGEGFNQSLTTVVMGEEPEYWSNFPHTLSIQDLDADGQDEIVLIVSTPGASCCTTLSIVYYDEASQRYASTQPLYRKYTLGFDVQDLDGDGLIEIRTLNEDFNYALGGATVVSFLSPLQIFGYAEGKLFNKTAQFPDLLSQSAQHWAEDKEFLCMIFGAGAYLAEMHMLNQAEAGWALIDEKCDLPPEDVEALGQALRDYGYAEN
ncbi:MAG: hypothetical protein KDJ52_29490 [Anaerolineae bacterium]|nr:hypothetical protein [Anaerolineae bacterium]